MDKTQNAPLILKKVNKTKKISIKLGIYFGISFLLVIVLIFGFSFLLNRKSDLLKEVSTLKAQNQKAADELKDMENKYNTSKGYLDSWEESFSERQRKFLGVNIENLKKDITTIAENNRFSNLDISFSPIVNVGGVFEKKTVLVKSILVTINFSTLTDINVYSFLNDLRNNLDGFILMSSLSLKITRKIDNSFLDELQKGSKPTAIDGSLRFRFYGLEAK